MGTRAANTQPTSRYLPAALVAGGLLLIACPAPPGQPGNCVPVGALLPFTGDLAGEGSNIERSLRLSVEYINQAGGVAGREVCLLSRDTHSEIDRGVQVARSLVEYKQVAALLGPSNDDLALRVTDLLRERQVLGISGGTSAPALRLARDGGLWFRTAPSALLLGRALAERMIADGMQRASVIYEISEFGTGWANVVSSNFSVLGGESYGIFSYRPGQPTYATVLNEAFATGVDAVVLVASARSGAAIVEEWATSGRRGRWYFAPSLGNSAFVDNIPPGVVDGMVGIAPGLGEHAARFEQKFTTRWSGDTPLRPSYYYSDALVLWALAYQQASQAQDPPSALRLSQALVEVASPPGIPVAWHEFERALDLVSRGEDIDFEGASGPVDLDTAGDVISGSYEYWRVTADAIEPEPREP